MKIDPAAQCRFFNAEDACRLALSAYYAAGRNLEPPPGEPWIVDGEPYASASDFADAFAAELSARLGLLALDRLGSFHPTSDRYDPWAMAYQVDPEKMRPIIEAREADMRQDEAVFLGDEMHRLPPEDNHVHNAPTMGEDNA
jgi:hypothetical protein